MKKLITIILIVLFPLLAFGMNVTVTWNAPTTWSDGSPLTTITGYNIYYGNVTNGPYPNKVVVGNVTSHVMSLTNGTWYIVNTALATNAAGETIESSYSNELMKIIDERVPNPPSNLSFVTGLGVQ
jgi:hypothetical protein